LRIAIDAHVGRVGRVVGECSAKDALDQAHQPSVESSEVRGERRAAEYTDSVRQR